MEMLVRQIGADEVEHEITQRDQFNTDEFTLLETLIRETEQNSQDAKDESNPGPVRSTIRFLTSSGGHEAYWGDLLRPLFPHLEACELDTKELDFSKIPIMVIEDFGTTGLLGAYDKKDSRNFSDFWRRFGRSHKGGTSAGRWGLGKLVYSSASRMRTFFGLTVRADDPQALLMGQALLANHRVGANEYAPHVFFANAGPGHFQLPERDSSKIGEFAEASGMERTIEPGLSLVIPFVNEDITADALLPFVIRNYFFSILTSRLVVEIGDYVVDAENFDALAKTHGGKDLADGHLISFIRSVHASMGTIPAVTIQNWAPDMKAALSESQISTLRERYARGDLVAVRASFLLSEKDGTKRPTHVDLYMRAAPPGIPGQALYVRGDLTIPGEAKTFRGRDAFAALVARDPAAATFLGDAENPAHTRWIGSAEKLKARWRNAAVGVASIRASLNLLYNVLVDSTEKIDNDALLKFFFVKRATPAGGKKTKGRPPPPPVITRSPKRYRLTKVAGGFRLRGEKTADFSTPYSLNISAAYDVSRGNPLTRHSPYDFDFTKGGSVQKGADVDMESSGAILTVTSPRDIEVEVVDPDFEVTVTGFDTNRDVFVAVTPREP